jgi:hypothetical protein
LPCSAACPRFCLVVCLERSIICCWGSLGSYGWLLAMTLNPLVGDVAAICNFVLLVAAKRFAIADSLQLNVEICWTLSLLSVAPL